MQTIFTAEKCIFTPALRYNWISSVVCLQYAISIRMQSCIVEILYLIRIFGCNLIYMKIVYSYNRMLLVQSCIKFP